MNKKTLLQTIWIFVLFNYLYCDVLSLMDSGLLKQYLAGTVNGMVFNPGTMLGAAFLMEIPMAAILLTRVLNYKANRWVNIIAGVIMTAVQLMSLFVARPAPYYLFCSIIEIASTVAVVWLAWAWHNQEA